jgi:hypothetical protein
VTMTVTVLAVPAGGVCRSAVHLLLLSQAGSAAVGVVKWHMTLPAPCHSVYQVFFCNTGTEANEAAIKFARKWARVKVRSDMWLMPRLHRPPHSFTCKTSDSRSLGYLPVVTTCTGWR